MLLIFNNGLYLSDCDKFYKNDDIPEKFKQFIDKECTYDSHENFVSKVYLDFNFEVYSSNIVSEILIKKKKYLNLFVILFRVIIIIGIIYLHLL